MSRPLVMGIVNVTPDSFSDGGRLADDTVALRHCEQLLKDGAHLLDQCWKDTEARFALPTGGAR